MNYKIFFLLIMLISNNCLFPMDCFGEYKKEIGFTLCAGLMVYVTLKAFFVYKARSSITSNSPTITRHVYTEQRTDTSTKKQESLELEKQLIKVNEQLYMAWLMAQPRVEGYKQGDHWLPFSTEPISQENYIQAINDTIKPYLDTITNWDKPQCSIVSIILNRQINLSLLSFFTEYTPEEKKDFCKNILKYHGFLDECLHTSNTYISELFSLCKSHGVDINEKQSDEKTFLQRAIERYNLYRFILKCRDLSLPSNSSSVCYRPPFGYMVNDIQSNEQYPFYNEELNQTRKESGEIELGDGLIIKKEFCFPVLSNDSADNKTMNKYKAITDAYITFLQKDNIDVTQEIEIRDYPVHHRMQVPTVNHAFLLPTHVTKRALALM